MNAPGRLVSLDAFRGATVAGMLLVNNPGSWSDIYAPLQHAPWHGWTFADTIFPSFLWIMGVSLTFAFSRRLETATDRSALWRHVLQRSAIIFSLGLLLSAFPFGLLPTHDFSFSTLRIPGVLQRIALCYLAASAICLYTGWKGQTGWAAGLLLVYWALLMLVPVPGFGAGHIGGAGGNLAWWIDSHLLAGHTWRGAPAPGFDPEGLLSTLPAIATTLFGAAAGQLVRRSSGRTLTLRLLAGGGVLLGLGAAWHQVFPINKSLWTSSYALFMAGWAMVSFSVFYWLIEVLGWRKWSWPFVLYGVNALALFVLAGLAGRLLTYIQWTNHSGARITLKGWLYAGFTPWLSPLHASLVFALSFVFVFLAIAWVLWRRKWFLKV